MNKRARAQQKTNKKGKGDRGLIGFTWTLIFASCNSSMKETDQRGRLGSLLQIETETWGNLFLFSFYWDCWLAKLDLLLLFLLVFFSVRVDEQKLCSSLFFFFLHPGLLWTLLPFCNLVYAIFSLQILSFVIVWMLAEWWLGSNVGLIICSCHCRLSARLKAIIPLNWSTLEGRDF